MNFKGVICTIAWMVAFCVLTKAQNPNCIRNTQEPTPTNANSFINSPEKSPHPCLRDCTGSKPMQCEYTFVVEWYNTMSKACYDCPCNLTDCQREQCVAADGVPRPIIVANRSLPGPPIEVCDGDEVIVNTVNHMDNGESITLHWHGLYQKSTQYMDGVFKISQCPILPGNKFRYNFIADHPGTHFWHAHTGMHRADGLFGPLIIRQSKQDDPHNLLYDHDLPEHTVFLSDWMHKAISAAYLSDHFRGVDEGPVTILINGMGASAVYGSTSSTTPRVIYEVQQGKRYRFRVISSAITNIPMKVSVDGHKITLISSDGDNFEPLEVDAFFLFGGERYDFILDASQNVSNYWLKVQGYKQGTGLRELAVIRYRGAPEEVPTADPSVGREGKVYQDLGRNYNEPEAVHTVNELRSLDAHTQSSDDNMRRVYLPFDLNAVNNPMFNDPDLYPLGPSGPGWGDFHVPQINSRTFKFLDFPLLSQFDDQLAAAGAYDDVLCEVEQAGFESCDTEFCACTQYIDVDLGQRLEIVLIDEGLSPYKVEHPFHLHGHPFRILAQGISVNGTTKEDVIQLDKNGGIVRNYDHAPGKDTVVIPSGGYTVIDFVANNPGWWILHCHMEFHFEDGMGILIRVGNQSDLPPVPEGFPMCGDYPPTQYPSTESDPVPSQVSMTMTITEVILVAVIAGLVILIIVLIVVIVVRERSRNDGKGRPQAIPMNER
ncbi:laccase-like [Lytechinus variegatus]|uniref:laccase-like n=1 Tax=Lytechinus variegatus TaxID=7654 RepID=UPI001BB1D576|nr:laccase-like [Lytechinus variegatus]